MAHNRNFEIAFVGLKPGIHVFNYELGDKFFKEKGAQDIENGEASVKLTLEKNSGFMLMKFDVDGKANVSCDRCGNPLNMSLWDEFKMLVKMVDNPEEMNNQEEDPDVHYITRTESHLDVSDWLYEFVLLSIPMQRMCPLEEIGGPRCNLEVLEKLKAMEAKTTDSNAGNLWKGLEKFKEN
ncbi:MAG: DUF177 domain-containing protein [Ferruginibacter sp.]